MHRSPESMHEGITHIVREMSLNSLHYMQAYKAYKDTLKTLITNKQFWNSWKAKRMHRLKAHSKYSRDLNFRFVTFKNVRT